MNVGIFLATLRPTAAAEQRFQGAIFDALTKFSAPEYKFFVLTHELPDAPPASDRLTYVKLAERGGRAKRALGLWKRLAGKYLLAAVSLIGAREDTMAAIRRWACPEPPHRQQVRDLDLRIIWNLSQKVLDAPVPFIRIVWDVNHRIHSMFPEFAYTRYGFDGIEHDMPASLARASYVLVGTHEGKRELETMYNVYPAKIRVVPFPTPIMPPRAAPIGRMRETPYIFYPARFWPHKNHVVVLEALKILGDKWQLRPDCVFSGVDEGNLDYVQRYAERLGVRDQIHYIGSVAEDQLTALYEDAAALVYASAVGPDNLPPLEAMALGCPVITAEVPGAHEQYGDAPLFFPSTDEDILAQHIRTVLTDDAVRHDLIERGRRRAASWTPDDYVKSVIDILEEFEKIARAWERCDSEFT